MAKTMQRRTARSAPPNRGNRPTAGRWPTAKWFRCAGLLDLELPTPAALAPAVCRAYLGDRWQPMYTGTGLSD